MQISMQPSSLPHTHGTGFSSSTSFWRASLGFTEGLVATLVVVDDVTDGVLIAEAAGGVIGMLATGISLQA